MINYLTDKEFSRFDFAYGVITTSAFLNNRISLSTFIVLMIIGMIINGILTDLFSTSIHIRNKIDVLIFINTLKDLKVLDEKVTANKQALKKLRI